MSTSPGSSPPSPLQVAEVVTAPSVAVVEAAEASVATEPTVRAEPVAAASPVAAVEMALVAASVVAAVVVAMDPLVVPLEAMALPVLLAEDVALLPTSLTTQLSLLWAKQP